MGNLSVKENQIIISEADELAVLEPWGKDCLRFRSTPNGRLNDENWNLLEQPAVTCSTSLEGEKATITNGKLSAEFYSSGKVIYYKNGKEILTERSETGI